MVRFPQRSGALKEFLNDVLSEGDDIVHFEYSKKHNRENGPVFIGIELHHRDNFDSLLEKMKSKHFRFEYLNDKPDLLQYLI
jgi:threonine dehydratase